MDELVDSLIKIGYLKTPTIIEAFKKVDRKNFVPPELENEAYGDYPLPIGYGQTISQPLTVAFMLELLQAQSGEHILEVGAGSGWQTALLAELVGQKGKVVAIERIPELAETAKNNLAPYNYSQVELVLGDGSKGYSKASPFDKIIAAASSQSVPEVWKEQIKAGGLLVFPMRWSIWKVTKMSDKEFKKEEHPGFVFVPLIEE